MTNALINTEKIIIILFLFFQITVNAQTNDFFIRNRESTLSFNNSVDANLLNNTKSDISLKKIEETKRFTLFNQTYNDIDIYSATLKINYRNGKEIFSSDNTISNFEVINNEFPTETSVKNIIEINDGEIISSKKIYFPISSIKITSALKVYVEIETLTYIYVVNSENEILYKQCIDFTKRKTSNILLPATGSVFMPDPITSAKLEYGGDLVHNNGQSNQALENQQVEVALMCKVENGIYYLENNDVKIIDDESPHWDIVTSTNGEFNFNRSEIGFQQVNAFYHISEMAKQIDIYGFTDAVDYTIKVDADACEGADQSYFKPKKSLIVFGAYTGKDGDDIHIPDAEDAEVIIHEYTHAIINTYCNNRFTNERKSMEEGFCDYMAKSYSTDLGDYNWQKIFKWDGNLSWQGRSAVSTESYTSITRFKHAYDHCGLWTSALMDIYFEIGKETTDKLVLHTITGLDGNTTMKKAATIMIAMDIEYFGGVNVGAISSIFNNYSIIDKTLNINTIHSNVSCKIINTLEFTNGKSAYISLNKKLTGSYSLYSIDGTLVKNIKYINKKLIEVNSENIGAGVYVLRFNLNNSVKTFKLIKH